MLFSHFCHLPVQSRVRVIKLLANLGFLLLFLPAVLKTCTLLFCMPYIHKGKKLHCLLVWSLFVFSCPLLNRTVFMRSLEQNIKEIHSLLFLMLII